MPISKNRPICPILLTTKTIGRKWTVPVIEEIYLSKNKSSFNRIQKALKTITPRNLNICLKELSSQKIIKKNTKKINGLEYSEYSLTKKGMDFQNLINSFKKFVMHYYGNKFNFCLVTKCSDCGKFHKSINL